MTSDQGRICERIRRVGYSRGSQVNLYGQVFELLSDPFVIGDGPIFLDGIEQKSRRICRVRVPWPVVQMATTKVEIGKAV